jgi:hypothetical protein
MQLEREARLAKQGQMTRRAVLRGAGGAAALAAVALTAGGTAHGVRAEAGQHLEGSWINIIMPAGPAPAFRTLSTYDPNGTVLASALPYSPAPPPLGVARVHVSTSHGEWYRTGDRTFAATFIALLADDGGAFVATQKVSTSITLDEGGNSFNAEFQSTYSGPDGSQLVAFGGTVQASRIQVEPLQSSSG